jgi:hypothetical protein
MERLRLEISYNPSVSLDASGKLALREAVERVVGKAYCDYQPGTTLAFEEVPEDELDRIKRELQEDLLFPTAIRAFRRDCDGNLAELTR